VTATDTLPALEELQPGQQWICFIKSKVPYNPNNGQAAQSDTPTTWASYDLAWRSWVANSGYYAGIGRMFLREQRITGIDLDHCIDDQGNIAAWAQRIVDWLNSYTEYSPSGRGLHIWIHGIIPANLAPAKPQPDGIEMYDHGRYFTWTGKHLEGTPGAIEDRYAEIFDLYQEVTTRRAHAKTQQTGAPPPRGAAGDTPYGLSALADECAKVSMTGNGARNNQLNESAFRLGQLVAGGELTRQTVERELEDAALRAGLSGPEIAKTIRSGIDGGMKKDPRSAPKDKEQHSDTHSPLDDLFGQAENEQPKAKTERRIRFKSSAEMKQRPVPSELIFGVLPAQSISMSFGESGTFKSFIVLDWCECISRGLPWLGRKTTKGPIAYIAAEGAAGIGRRLFAWETHHKAADSDGIKWFDSTLVMQDAANFKELITALKEDYDDMPPIATVIDTLSRCSGGADENSNTEMAKVIAAADAIRQKIGSAVHIIHHAGKDREKGPRGASALIGNMEAIIAFDRTEEGVKLTSFKQKDVEPFSPIYLKPIKVTYGTGQYDNSLVLVPGDPAKPQMKASESAMLLCLAGKQLTHKEWTDAGMLAGLSRSSATSAIKQLKDTGRVQLVGKLYSIPTTGGEAENEEN